MTRGVAQRKLINGRMMYEELQTLNQINKNNFMSEQKMRIITVTMLSEIYTLGVAAIT